MLLYTLLVKKSSDRRWQNHLGFETAPPCGLSVTNEQETCESKRWLRATVKVVGLGKQS